MKITLESTTRIVTVAGQTKADGVQGRVWQGTTDSGIPVAVVITSLAVKADQDQRQFQGEFQEHAAPRPEAVEAFPLKFVL